MSLLGALLKPIISKPNPLKQQSVIFVAPHPDDIEIGAGGTVLRLLSLGVRVTYVVCTNGCYGSSDPNIDTELLAQTRRQEELAASAYYGVKDVIFLPFSDGGNYDVYDLSIELSKIICDVKPDMIFCPDHLVANELHIDHLKCGQAVSNAFVLSSTAPKMKEYGKTAHQMKGIGYYYTNKPNCFIRIGRFQKKQIEGLKLHHSQLPTSTKEEKQTTYFMLLYIKLRSVFMGISRLRGRVEGFRILDKILCHCAAE